MPTEGTVNIPVFVATKIFDLAYERQNTDRIDGFARIQLDPHMRAFMDICGACERIKNSPWHFPTALLCDRG
jgi:Bestrophin.